ncbi:MAG: hypothetical protein B6244_01910 [Candidatus Cloacimonetes bacterium 4572_55]|nr:MAG: hypothetical protein B6244_01910 [Candidatus Cloacimonetes bacterium 4572_55]
MPILDQIDLVLFPGQYSATLTVKDKYAERQAIYVDTLDIPEFNDNELLLSNIQFSSLVESSEEESEIVKNGLLIVPHPSRLFGEGVGLPLLYFYVEIYNLGVEEGKKGTFQADYQIVDFSGKTIKSFPIQNVTAYGPSAILASAIKLENVPLGNKYFLSIKITDPLTGKSAARREPFHVFQGVDQLIAKDREEFYIPDLTEENEPGYYGQAFHHFNERDIQLYKSLSFIGKRQFLIDFWENLDPTPGTPVNEFFNENAQRFLFATKEYGYSNVPGWRSDRGRVFILYGQVSEIDREYFSKDFAPYEIWVYNDLGDHISISKETRTTYSLPEDDIYLLGKAAYFVFGELNNDGNYYLIHSNVDGELKSIDWRGDLKKYEEGHIFHSRRQGQDSDEIQIGTND